MNLINFLYSGSRGSRKWFKVLHYPTRHAVTLLLRPELALHVEGASLRGIVGGPLGQVLQVVPVAPAAAPRPRPAALLAEPAPAARVEIVAAPAVVGGRGPGAAGAAGAVAGAELGAVVRLALRPPALARGEPRPRPAPPPAPARPPALRTLGPGLTSGRGLATVTAAAPVIEGGSRVAFPAVDSMFRTCLIIV